MYRKLLYNDDCILNTISNTVIFDFEEDWKLYLEWGNSNIEEVRKDVLLKKNKLLWNGGIPKEETTETGYISTLCDTVGNIVKRTIISDDTTTTEIFHSSGKLRTKITWKKNNTKHIININGKIRTEISCKGADIIKASLYYLNGTLLNDMISSHDGNCITKTYYDTAGILMKLITENIKVKTKLVKVFNEHGNLFTLTNYRNGMLNGLHQSFDNDGKLIKECLYDTDNKIKYKNIYHSIPSGNLLSISYKKTNDGTYDVINFFHGTDVVRASGVQTFSDSDTELEHGFLRGKWTFYHSSGTKESEHVFVNNKLITSEIYYEDNTLNARISHV